MEQKRGQDTCENTGRSSASSSACGTACGTARHRDSTWSQGLSRDKSFLQTPATCSECDHFWAQQEKTLTTKFKELQATYHEEFKNQQAKNKQFFTQIQRRYSQVVADLQKQTEAEFAVLQKEACEVFTLLQEGIDQVIEELQDVPKPKSNSTTRDNSRNGTFYDTTPDGVWSQLIEASATTEKWSKLSNALMSKAKQARFATASQQKALPVRNDAHGSSDHHSSVFGMSQGHQHTPDCSQDVYIAIELQEALRQEAARQEAARQEALRQEALRQEALRQEAARQEALRQEAARQEAARQEAARQEVARQEAALWQEAARQEEIQLQFEADSDVAFRLHLQERRSTQPSSTQLASTQPVRVIEARVISAADLAKVHEHQARIEASIKAENLKKLEMRQRVQQFSPGSAVFEIPEQRNQRSTSRVRPIQ